MHDAWPCPIIPWHGTLSWSRMILLASLRRNLCLNLGIVILKCLVVKFSIDFFIMWIAVQKCGSPLSVLLVLFGWIHHLLDHLQTVPKCCSYWLLPVKYTVLQKCKTVWLCSHIHTVHHIHCHSNTTSGLQFCMPAMNIHTTVHNEAYLNRTDYHTVKHHSWRNCNILYTVKPNDVTKSVNEESKCDRWYCIHKPVLCNKKLPLPFP